MKRKIEKNNRVQSFKYKGFTLHYSFYSVFSCFPLWGRPFYAFSTTISQTKSERTRLCMPWRFLHRRVFLHFLFLPLLLPFLRPPGPVPAWLTVLLRPPGLKVPMDLPGRLPPVLLPHWLPLMGCPHRRHLPHLPGCRFPLYRPLLFLPGHQFL